MMQKHSLFRLLILAIAVAPAIGNADDWGGIKGRFVVQGDPPKLDAPKVTKDKFCIDCKPTNQTVQIGKSGGLANALVWVRLPRNTKLPLPKDDSKHLATPVKLANKRCVFTPHVALVRVGQELVITNEDPTGHNTKLDLIRNAAFNQLIPAKGSVKKKFDQAESKPLPVSCNIHPFMQAYLFVTDHPYVTVSSSDGSFEIKALPAGEHEIQFWHETGYLKNMPLAKGQTNRRGRIKLSIPAGKTLDLGVIRVPAELLAD